MYSQNDEEKYILDFFGGQIDNFLDIGSFDGKAFSNTYALVERGWGGICVEPSPSVFYRLLNLHRKNDKIKMVNAAIAASSGIMEFYDSSGDAISSLDVAHKEKWEKGWKSEFTKIWVPTITTETLFLHFGFDYAFVNLDVEAMNYAILMTLPFNKLKARMICVEHDGHQTAMMNHLKQFGFRKLTENGENLILVR